MQNTNTRGSIIKKLNRGCFVLDEQAVMCAAICVAVITLAIVFFKKKNTSHNEAQEKWIKGITLASKDADYLSFLKSAEAAAKPESETEKNR